MQVFVDRQFFGVVVTHHQSDRVAAGDVAVLLAQIDLVLLTVEAMHEIARAAAGQRTRTVLQDAVQHKDILRRTGFVGGGDKIVDLERLVQKSAREGRRAGVVGTAGRQRRRCQIDVVLQQALVFRHIVLPDLRGVGKVGKRQPVDGIAMHFAPQPIQIVEAVVLLVDDDDMLEFVKRSQWRSRLTQP